MRVFGIRLATTPSDFDAARALCREWYDWHWANFPKDGPRSDNPMSAASFEPVIRDLELIHARPFGGILLAELDGRSLGCVMFQRKNEQTAEINRFFVGAAGRGHRLGQRLLEAMFDQMRDDGYKHVMFSSAVFLTHARALYEKVGFVDMPQPEEFPQRLRDFVYFMERPL